MILGIMQPYFFPYFGYYQLMAAVDRWIVFDIVNYAHRSWMNRNRILHPTTGWQYVVVPVHAGHDTRIDSVSIVDRDATRRRILGQLDHYRGRAPYFGEARRLVERAFDRTTSDKLRDLNLQSLLVACEYLGIQTNCSICSEMTLDLPPIDHPGQWALEISKALGARRYINPPGGRAIFRPDEWNAAGIELRFLASPPFEYRCGPYEPQLNLSMLDVLMWNDRSVVVDRMRTSLSLST